MAKKIVSLITMIAIISIMTLSVVTASGGISIQMIDDDLPDLGSTTPITINEYV